MQTVGNTEEWETPQWLFNKLDAEFHFTLDPCATDLNCKCEKYYTKEDDGLSQDWKGETVFCNPPYGRELSKWIQKCAYESKKKQNDGCYADTEQDGHKGFSRLHRKPGGTSVYTRKTTVW